jgi:flagellar secretion chaperone FliS
MATFEAAKNRYVSDSVGTMSPGHLIVALYNRVLLDLDRALTAMNDHDVFAAHTALIHAQQIVDELLNSLDLKLWPDGQSLAAIYRRVQSALIAANVAKDPAPVHECRALLVPLRDAWREAAGVVGSNAGAAS